LSQPAMSGALHRLREYFKDPLLIRMGRDMVLTPLGESLVSPVRVTLLHVQSTLATRPAFDQSVSRRKFTLAMSDYGAFVLMPPLLRRLPVEAPFMTCNLEPIGGETFDRLECGDLDLLVTVESCEVGLRQRDSARDLKMRRLLYDDFVCVADENHPDIGDVLTMEDYERLPHILVRFGANLDTLVEQAWKLEELTVNIAATAPSFSSMLFMLPGTAMIGTVQRRFAQALAAPLRLKILECPVPMKALQQILLWHPRNHADPGHQYLRQMLVEAAGVGTARRDHPVGRNGVHASNPRSLAHEILAD
jgi:LysR family nod box-dependent transcriptional activator